MQPLKLWVVYKNVNHQRTESISVIKNEQTI